MSTQLTSYKIFIASPGGLDLERKKFREIVNEYNETEANARGVHFIPIGWEITLGGVGRPQSIINEELKKCDYFILLLWDRWGTPTENVGYSSGTHEEFEVAISCQKDVSMPMKQVICFFKAVEPRQLADPGDQLKKVLDFKKEREAKKDLLYREFDDVDNFNKWLRAYLAQWMRDHEEGNGDKKKNESSPTPGPISSGASTIQNQLQLGIMPIGSEQSEQLKKAQALADQGKLVEAEEIFVRAAIRGNDLQAINQYGNFLLRVGRFNQAQAMYERVLEISKFTGQEENVAIAYGNLGVVYSVRGDLGKAEEMFRSSLELNEKVGRREGMAHTYGSLGNLYRIRADLKKSEDMFRKALEIDESLQLEENMAINCNGLGIVFVIRGNLNMAEEMIQKSLKIFKHLGKQDGIADSYSNLAQVYSDRGDLDKAEEFFLKALEISKILGNLSGMSSCYTNLGIVYGKRKDLIQSENMFRKALEMNEGLGYQEGVAKSYGNLGNIYWANNKLEKSEEMYRKALEISERLGLLEGIAKSYNNLGGVFEKRGELNQTREFLEKALEVYAQIGVQRMVETLRNRIQGLP